MTIRAQRRDLTAEALAAELKRAECASVIVVGEGDEPTARRLTNGYGKPALRISVDPHRAAGEWELF